MIQLNNDSLLFQLADGQVIPCSVERFTFELVGENAQSIDNELVREAAAAVVHYFKSELKRTTITVGEFTQALEQVLRSLGFSVTAALPPAAQDVGDPELDLGDLAVEATPGFELAFFQRLRAEMHRRLSNSPQIVRFTGLRRCAKQLVGARRWSDRCTRMSDQIVDYLRDCLSREAPGTSCPLVVR